VYGYSGPICVPLSLTVYTGHIKQVGHRTTKEAARDWEKE